MVRTVDYDSRRRAVLASTINRYIKDASPVSSDDLAQDFDLSPATIRNILAELEDTGYLTHPYTSGGRMPTYKGYRYYVDFLLSQMCMFQGEKERITKEYRMRIKRIEDTLERTSDLVSQITHYAGIVSFIDWEDKLFYRGVSFILDQPEFQNFDKMRILIGMIEDKKRLLNIINKDFDEKVKVYIGDEIECPEMRNCSIVVSGYRRKSKPSGRIAVLGPMRMEYSHIIPSLEYISDVLSEALENI